MILATVDRFDGPEQAMLLVSVVGLVGTLLTVGGVVVTAIIANGAKKHSQVIREQVENDHKDAKNPNLRVDLDDKFETLEQSVQAVHKGNDRIMSKLSVVEGDVSLLKEGYVSNRQRIESIEDTAAQERRQRAMWGPPATTRRERRDRDNAR